MQIRFDPGAWAIYALVRALFWAIGHFPPPFGLGLSALCFRFLDRMVPRLRQVALRNLTLALPNLTSEARAALVTRMYGALARHLWVVAKTSGNQFNTIENYLTIENLHYVSNALAKGNGLLFATGHLGAWEISAMAFGRLVAPMDVVARPLDNPYIDRWIGRLRTQTGNRVLQKSGTLREVLRALQSNRAVGFLLDQNVISQDLCFIDFFGIQSSASTAFAKIAARSGATVVPGFAIWSEQKAKYVLRFEPPVPITGDAVQDTQEIQKVIERAIKRAPEQWLWIHRRFKNRPPGEDALYSYLSKQGN